MLPNEGEFRPLKVVTKPGTIVSAKDKLFTSGSMGRYSKTLNSVMEAPGALYGGKA